jgi:AbrB family looped-hinge helix DNA binding protein
MKLKIAKFTTRGRITIPAKLRKKYKLHPGTKVKFVVEKDGIKIIPIGKTITKEIIRDNAGILGMKGELLKSLMEEKPSRSASGGKREREL